MSSFAHAAETHGWLVDFMIDHPWWSIILLFVIVSSFGS